ncbi:hypothetical protein [Bradyrhizobium neotropicale]|uniref:hypothetical protein n=1 Tax=Bradyrhizobium neotropicale TaxID=1497615 RepID=UPI001AD68061|nr:hypothetical protein [Bradyrhizobium neotropicale]MBO4226449.1 hypothetical protein [Bradyrhizobium neotropicale]
MTAFDPRRTSANSLKIEHPLAWKVDNRTLALATVRLSNLSLMDHLAMEHGHHEAVLSSIAHSVCAG